MPISRINNNSIANNTIVAADLAAGSVTGDKLGATAINANNIVNGTITTTQIASNTISNTNIQTGAIENYSRATGLLSGMRNRIINGAMVIDQRNAGASVSMINQAYNLDRWQSWNSDQTKLTVQRNAGSVTPPAGFTNYLGITSTSAYSVGSGDYFAVRQQIEGYNVADLNFGSANAKTVTLSFWVRSSLTGTFGGVLENEFTRSYPFTYTISAANTWEYKTVIVAGDTSGSWNTTNGTGLVVIFSLGVGSTYSAAAGAWTNGTIIAPTGATSVVGTNGATFYITGVQLEVGSTATSFDYRSYGTELQLCQRYYYVSLNDSNSASAVYAMTVSCNVTSGTNYHGSLTLPVSMRAIPSVTWIEGTSSNFPSTDPSFSNGGRNSIWGYKGATATSSGYWIGNVRCSAEL